MAKTIYDIMSNDEKPVEDFFAAAAEVVRTRYILAEKKINNMMKLVASSRILYDFFGRVLNGFDYEAEVRRCTIDDGGRSKLILPKDAKKATALVFCLLMDIDNKNIFLSDFLRSFFLGDSDINMAYEMFCQEVLLPFIDYAQKLLREGISMEEPRNSEMRDYIEVIAKLAAFVEKEPHMSERQKETLILNLDKIGSCFKDGNPKQALVMYESLSEELNYTSMPPDIAEALKTLRFMLMK